MYGLIDDIQKLQKDLTKTKKQYDDLLEQAKDATQIIKDIVDVCREYPTDMAALKILALLKRWSKPPSNCPDTGP